MYGKEEEDNNDERIRGDDKKERRGQEHNIGEKGEYEVEVGNEGKERQKETPLRGEKTNNGKQDDL